MDAKGHKWITQTKFHADPEQSVGSREVDEIVIALNKFGAKHGVFATTGRISPQAKRECLNDYPGFTVEFLEGTDIVDEVLSHPVLAAVWSSGHSITAANRPLLVPFALRDGCTDRPIRGVTLVPFAIGEAKATSLLERAGPAVLGRYRFPSIADPLGTREAEWCPHVVVRGAVHLHEVPELVRRAVDEVASQVRALSPCVQLRRGVPSIVRIEGEKIQERVQVDQFEAETFVVTAGGVFPEREWLLVPSTETWEFPVGFGTLEADWAGWYNSRLDCVFMLYIRTPAGPHTVGINEMLRQVKERFLRESLFLGGTDDQCDAFIAGLPPNDLPSWQCEYGPGGRMLAWIHPYADDERRPSITFDGEPQPTPEAIRREEDFRKAAARVRAAASTSKLKEINCADAIRVSDIAGESLLPPIVENEEFTSARLVHYLDELPSPANLAGRSCVFVQMWSVNDAVRQSQEKLDDIQIPNGTPGKFYFDAKRAPRFGTCFVMSSVSFTPDPTSSTVGFLEANSGCLQQALDAIRAEITRVWPGARLATREFWRNEIGLF